MEQEKINALIQEIQQYVKDNPAPKDITFYITKQQLLDVCKDMEVDPKPYLKKFFNE